MECGIQFRPTTFDLSMKGREFCDDRRAFKPSGHRLIVLGCPFDPQDLRDPLAMVSRFGLVLCKCEERRMLRQSKFTPI